MLKNVNTEKPTSAFSALSNLFFHHTRTSSVSPRENDWLLKTTWTNLCILLASVTFKWITVTLALHSFLKKRGEGGDTTSHVASCKLFRDRTRSPLTQLHIIPRSWALILIRIHQMIETQVFKYKYLTLIGHTDNYIISHRSLNIMHWSLGTRDNCSQPAIPLKQGLVLDTEIVTFIFPRNRCYHMVW